MPNRVAAPSCVIDVREHLPVRTTGRRQVDGRRTGHETGRT